jgi:hypothetical protein
MTNWVTHRHLTFGCLPLDPTTVILRNAPTAGITIQLIMIKLLIIMQLLHLPLGLSNLHSVKTRTLSIPLYTSSSTNSQRHKNDSTTHDKGCPINACKTKYYNWVEDKPQSDEEHDDK